MQTATPLPSIEALTAPADRSDCHPHYGFLGFLKGVLEDGAKYQLLIAHISTRKEGPLRDAMLSGAGYIYDSVRNDARQATQRGHLLLCWPGTTLLKGAAS
jgi:hypothetical protein